MVNRRSASFYSQFSDEEIAMMAQTDRDAEAFLTERYGSLVRRMARAYFLMGGEEHDLAQEGSIGLLRAIRTFSPEKKASFRSFAKLCINRQMLSAVKMAGRKKHRPLNSYVSLSHSGSSEEEGPMMEETVADPSSLTPEESFLRRESYRLTGNRAAARLSRLERQVLYLHLEGDSYEEIGEKIGRDAKAVDNALQRIRKKLKDIGF